MKKILYVTTVSSTLNAFFIPHIKYLITQGYEIKIASNIDQEVSKEFIKDGIEHIKIDFCRNPFSLKNLKAYRQILQLYRKEKFQVIHVHTPVAAFITRSALRNEKVKIIYTAHGFHFYKGAPVINWILYYTIEKIAARWTDLLVTINNEDYERGKKFILRNNGQVKQMHGVGINPKEYCIEDFEDEEYRNKIGVNKDDFLILVLSELNKNKNHIQVINAMDDLKDKNYNIKVICAGKGLLESSLKNKVKKKNLENNIKFIGFRNDVKELLNICDCVALFSKREGLGKCLLEGMVNGKALIATNTRGPRELIDNNENGFLVEVGDSKHLAKCIEVLYLNKNLQDKFKERSKEKVKKYYMCNVLKEIHRFY